MADGFGSLSALEMTLGSTKSAVAPAFCLGLAISRLAVVAHPGEFTPLVVDNVSAGCMILPSIVVSAETRSDLGLAANWNVGAINVFDGALEHGNAHLDLVVLPLLSEAGKWLLAAHLHAQLGGRISVAMAIHELSMVDRSGGALPWVAVLVVPLVLVVTDDTSLGDVAEVVFTLAVDRSVTLGVTSNSSTAKASGVGFFKTGPADTTVSESSGDGGNFGTIASRLSYLRLAVVGLLVVIKTVLGRDPARQNPGE